MSYQIKIIVNDEPHVTLADILPVHGPMRMLIVAKTPAPISLEKGHYFQGKQGQMFWNRLQEYGILRVPNGRQPDDILLEQGYGITDIVKVPRAFGNEPSDDEYRNGLPRILHLMDTLKPRVLMFVYKRALDNILRMGFSNHTKACYGFNPRLTDAFRTRVFVFPMPGTPCKSDEATVAMRQLADALSESIEQR